MEDAITRFLQFLTVEKGASQNTVAAYRNDIQQFAGFCAGGRTNGSRPSWSQIDRSRIQDYLRSLQQRDYADATVARKVAAIKSFFGF
ncbi:MAG TPA: site-specific integrase, partial [Dehalococcoidia bacterium]